MKIFLIDKTRKLKRISKALETSGVENIESKEDLKFRMTKNDYLILSDEDNLDGLEKLKNIILLVKDKNYKYIWNFINKYKILDIIDLELNEDYIANRIIKIVRSEQ